MHVWMLGNAWWLAICRQDFAETDGTLEYWARNGSCFGPILAKVPLLEMPLFEDTSRPSLKAGSCKIVEKDSLKGIAAYWNSYVNASDIASVANAFACLLFFISFFFISIFIIPFLPRSPFRVFGPPGNSFLLPLFCLNCLWRLSIHRGAHFCLSRPFRFLT